MSRDPAVSRIVRAAETAMGDDPKAATFVQGLALGALVGAAIAGSALWQRRHGRPKTPESEDAASVRSTLQRD